MSLKNDKYLILKQLFRNPVMPYSTLAKRVGLSPPTVKKRVDYLMRKGIITNINAEYFPEALDLESHILLLRVASNDKLRLVERILDLHPYVVLRTRIFGALSGIFLKVHIPLGSFNTFMKLMNHLKEAGLIEDIVPSSTIGRGIKTYIDLDYWNPKTSVWNFKWDMWQKNIDSIDYVPRIDYFQKMTIEKPTNVSKGVKYQDFKILKELTKDARQKYNLLSEQLSIPQYTFSRRLKFLNKYVIRNYLIDFDRTFFGLDDELIFKGICSQRAMIKIIYLLQNLALPFQSDFRQTDNGFLWKMILPPKDKLHVINLLWILFPDLQIMFVSPKGYVAKNFDPENYSFRDMDWKKSEDYLVNNVLDKAKKEFLLA